MIAQEQVKPIDVICLILYNNNIMNHHMPTR